MPTSFAILRCARRIVPCIPPLRLSFGARGTARATPAAIGLSAVLSHALFRSIEGNRVEPNGWHPNAAAKGTLRRRRLPPPLPEADVSRLSGVSVRGGSQAHELSGPFLAGRSLGTYLFG